MDNKPKYFINLLDITYVMTGSSIAYINKYDYLHDIIEKESAVYFIENNSLPYLSSSLTPFSFLLVNHITEYQVNDRDLWYNDEPAYVIGKRSLAVAMDNLSYMDEADIANFKFSILTGILSEKLKSRPDDELLDFTKYGKDTYSQYMSEIPAD